MSSSLLAKKVVIEIIRQAGGSLTSTTRLYQAFYIAHLYYAAEEPGYLTDWPIVRMPTGPAIDEGEELLHELVATGVVLSELTPVGPYQATTYRWTGKELPGEPLAGEAVAAIRKASEFVTARTTSELSELTHEHSRSWRKTENGRELNIYIDPIPEEEFTERQRRLASMRHKIAEVVRGREALPAKDVL